MKKMIYIILPIFLLMGTFAVASTASAEKELQGPPRHERKHKGDNIGIPHGRWWGRQRVRENLKLSDTQIEKLETISLTGRKEMIRLKADMEILGLELNPLMEAKKFDRAAVEAVIVKIEGIRAKMSKVRTKMLLDTREVLTQDQYKKLKEFRKIRPRRKARAGMSPPSLRPVR
jgi:Spy/CpxP family protein refolding chaperone